MKLIVGLGNPGKNYELTRHNIGFIVLDNYLKDVSWKEKFNANYYIINDICYIKPLTFMNNSGNAVRSFADYYNVLPEDILIIQDDLDMQFGTFKVKKNSSDGGHNGIKSIISCLNSQKFGRLKIGILNDKKSDVIDFVLSKFSKEEINMLDFEMYNKIIQLFIKYDIDKTIEMYRR